MVALFKDAFLAWRRKPTLEATCGKQTPWTVRTPIIVHSGGQVLWNGDCYFVRVKIENTGKTRAKKVQVSALNLWLANCYGRADFTGNRAAQVNWLSLSERIRWQ